MADPEDWGVLCGYTVAYEQYVLDDRYKVN
jgi:hypothetical protein